MNKDTTKMEKHNPTCLVTGKKENLKMLPLRNNNEDMIGWIFVSESVSIENMDAEINWKYKIKTKEVNE
jgi:hypothetical protein